MMCESAEMIFSPANTESAYMLRLCSSLSPSLSVNLTVADNRKSAHFKLWKLALSYETHVMKSNSLFLQRQLAGAPRGSRLFPGVTAVPSIFPSLILPVN